MMHSIKNRLFGRSRMGWAAPVSFTAILLFATMMTACENRNPADSSGNQSASISGSGGGKGSPAPESPICAKPPQVHEDTSAAPVFGGTCSDPSPASLGIAIKCTSEPAPVCGCDGKDYINACWAAGVGGVNVAHAGACAK
ncbi:MAG: hypothetical protein JWP91_3682 [Fibrobacteres bacterium]|nr:hypothetical protein [Fibrobacterota bacterium]